VIPNARGGASISSIRKDSPAARAGFPLGGVIFKVNELPVENPDDLIDYIASLTPGTNIELSYTHNDRMYRKQVKLSSIGGTAVASKPGAEDIEAPPPSPTPGGSEVKPVPGTPREGRPILDGIGRVLGGGPVVSGGGAAPSAQKQIDDLRALVTTLEERIANLEAQLAALRPTKPEETPAPPPAGIP
jgi:membrane-associated protease RseP (regulator of RpoE activity)